MFFGQKTEKHGLAFFSDVEHTYTNTPRDSTMQSQPIPLFKELVEINRGIMQEKFQRLQWNMVACWESNVSRHGNKIRLHETTIWVTPNRDPRGMMVMKFSPSIARQLGRKLKSESITSATNQEGDCSFVLGFANDEYVANDVVHEYVSAGTHTAVATVAYRPEEDARTRSTTRRSNRSHARKASA